jgi:hypothetical protein
LEQYERLPGIPLSAAMPRHAAHTPRRTIVRLPSNTCPRRFQHDASDTRRRNAVETRTSRRSVCGVVNRNVASVFVPRVADDHDLAIIGLLSGDPRATCTGRSRPRCRHDISRRRTRQRERESSYLVRAGDCRSGASSNLPVGEEGAT